MTLVPSVFGENLFDVFDNDFDRMFSNAFMRNPVMGKRASHVMKTDVRETENSYELDVDVPGFKKDEVNVQLEKGYLTISAGKKLDKDEKDSKATISAASATRAPARGVSTWARTCARKTSRPSWKTASCA